MTLNSRSLVYLLLVYMVLRMELRAPCTPRRTLYQLSLIFALQIKLFVKKPYTRFKISDLVLGNTSWKISSPLSPSLNMPPQNIPEGREEGECVEDHYFLLSFG